MILLEDAYYVLMNTFLLIPALPCQTKSSFLLFLYQYILLHCQQVHLFYQLTGHKSKGNER